MKHPLQLPLLFCLLLTLGLGTTSAQQLQQYYSSSWMPEPDALNARNEVQLFISHGHCQTPISAEFAGARINYSNLDFRDLGIDFEIRTHSLVAMGKPNSDFSKDLRSAHGFDAKNEPYIQFHCIKATQVGEDAFELRGEMKIRGEFKPLTLSATPVWNKEGCGKRLVKFLIKGEVNLVQYGYGVSPSQGAEASLEQGRPATTLNGKTMRLNLTLAAGGC